MAYRFETMDEAAREARLPDYLVEGLIPEKTVSVLTAKPGIGKTIFALSLAAAISRGQSVLGLQTLRSPTLCVLQDAPDWDYRILARKILRGMGLLGKDEMGDAYLMIQQGYELDGPAGTAELIDLIHRASGEEKCRFAVIDTLRSVHGGNENDSAYMRQVMQRVKEARRVTGAGFLVLHHTAKPMGGEKRSPEDSVRGSGEILAACDAQIHLTRTRRGVKLIVPRRRAGAIKGLEYEVGEKGNALVLNRIHTLEEAAVSIAGDWPEGEVRRTSAIEDMITSYMGAAAPGTVVQRAKRFLKMLVSAQLVVRQGVGKYKRTGRICPENGLSDLFPED